MGLGGREIVGKVQGAGGGRDLSWAGGGRRQGCRRGKWGSGSRPPVQGCIDMSNPSGGTFGSHLGRAGHRAAASHRFPPQLLQLGLEALLFLY